MDWLNTARGLTWWQLARTLRRVQRARKTCRTLDCAANCAEIEGVLEYLYKSSEVRDGNLCTGVYSDDVTVSVRHSSRRVGIESDDGSSIRLSEDLATRPGAGLPASSASGCKPERDFWVEDRGCRV